MNLIAGHGKAILLLMVALVLSGSSSATAQTPATNASGGQYLPAVPGGGGNRDEGALAGSEAKRGRTGLKSVGAGDDAANPSRLGLALPVALGASLLLALVVLGRRRLEPQPGQNAGADGP